MRALAVALLLASTPAAAGEADVVGVQIERQADGRYRVSVSLRHADAGWDHYADRWEVVAPDGTIIATRLLRHPHVREQPVTRDLSDVVIPDGVTRVTVRAHDSVHGWGGAEREVEVPRSGDRSDGAAAVR